MAWTSSARVQSAAAPPGRADDHPERAIEILDHAPEALTVQFAADMVPRLGAPDRGWIERHREIHATLAIFGDDGVERLSLRHGQAQQLLPVSWTGGQATSP